MGKRSFAAVLALMFVGVALAYLVKPFSLRLDSAAVYIGTPASFQGRIRAHCAAPWRQVVDAPSADFRTDDSGRLDVIQRNLQPLCRDTGRSRAIVSLWLLAAALGIVGVSRPWRDRRRAPRSEPGLVDAS